MSSSSPCPAPTRWPGNSPSVGRLCSLSRAAGPAVPWGRQAPDRCPLLVAAEGAGCGGWGNCRERRALPASRPALGLGAGVSACPPAGEDAAPGTACRSGLRGRVQARARAALLPATRTRRARPRRRGVATPSGPVARPRPAPRGRERWPEGARGVRGAASGAHVQVQRPPQRAGSGAPSLLPDAIKCWQTRSAVTRDRDARRPAARRLSPRGLLMVGQL